MALKFYTAQCCFWTIDWIHDETWYRYPAQFAALFVTKCHQRIDLRSTAGRNPARYDPGQQQQYRHAPQGHRIVGRHAPKLRRDYPRQQQARDQTNHGTACDQPHSHRHDQSQHIAPFRSERHANADFVCPLRRRVGEHAVDPDGYQNQPDAAENRHQQKSKPWTGVRKRVDITLQRSRERKRHAAICGPDLLLHAFQHRQRLLRRAHQDTALRRARDRIGHPELWPDRILQTVVLHIRNHPDNFEPRLRHRIGKRLQPHEVNALPDGIVVAQIPVRKGLVDDREFSLPVHFRFCEGPAVHELNAQRREIALAAQLKQCLPLFGVRLPNNIDVGANPTVWRQRARFRRVQHAWQRLYSLQQWLVKTGDLIGGFVTVPRQRKPRDQNMVRLESQVHFSQRDKTAHQQSCGSHERERKRHFQHYYGVAQSVVTPGPARSLPTIAQGIVQVASCGLQRRNQTENQRGQYRHAQCERQHRRVQLDDGLRGNNLLRYGRHQGLQSAPRNQCA